MPMAPGWQPCGSRGWPAKDGAANRAGGSGGGTAGHGTPPQANETTIMLRGLPKQSSEGELLQELGRYCRPGDYDFLYIPWDSKRGRNMGYAVVNFIQPRTALDTFHRMDGQPWHTPCRKAAPLTWQQRPNTKQHYHRLQTARVQGLRGIFADLAGIGMRQETGQHPPIVFSDGTRTSLQDFQQRFRRMSTSTSTTAEGDRSAGPPNGGSSASPWGLGAASGSASADGPPPAAPATPEAAALFGMLRRDRHGLLDMRPEHAAQLCRRLDRLQAADLGLERRQALRLQAGAAPGVGYQEVYSGTDLTLCIFVMRAGALIPLHDHPNMHVFGRLLFGRIRVASFDTEPAEPAAAAGYGDGDRDKERLRQARRRPLGRLWARQRPDEVLEAPATYMLGPQAGNLHELLALEDAAFFDVMVPPYDPQAGRHCTYYAPLPSPRSAAAAGHGGDAGAANGAANGAGGAACAEDTWAGGAGGGSRSPWCLLAPTCPAGFYTEPLEYLGPPFSPRAAGGAADGAAAGPAREG